MARILLVDDHTIIRSALKVLVKDVYPESIFDEAYDGESALDCIRTHDYALVVADVNLPNTDSFSLMSKILEEKPGTKILIFSMNPEDLYAKRYLKIGAMGYLRKDSRENEIKKAVTTVMNNGRYISDSLKDKLTEEALGKKSSNPFDMLSQREFEVLRYLVKGHSVAEISNHLTLHTSTIGTHKARIFEKLGVKNVVDISLLAKVNDIDLSE